MDGWLIEIGGPNDIPVTHPAAPGESIPAWLYRRALYLLVAGSSLRMSETRRIRDDLLTQTGLRIPDLLLSAIDLNFIAMNDNHHNRINAFTETEMRPAEGDFSVQPVPSIRGATVAQGAALGNAAERSAARYLSRSAVPEERRVRGNNNMTPANFDLEHNANEARRQRRVDPDLLLGLERPRPRATEEDRARQQRLRELLAGPLNAAEIIGLPLQGANLEPTNGYLPGVAEEYPTLRDERRRINHAAPGEGAARPQVFQALNNYDFAGEDPNLHYYSGPSGLQSVNDAMRPFQPNPNQRPPAPRRFEAVEAAALREDRRDKAGSKASTRKRLGLISNGRKTPAEGGKTPAAPRAAKKTPPKDAPERETRATAAKRKRDEEEAAATAAASVSPARTNNAHADSDKDQDDASAPPTKRARTKPTTSDELVIVNNTQASSKPARNSTTKQAEAAEHEQTPRTKKPRVMLKLNADKSKTAETTTTEQGQAPTPASPAAAKPSKIVVLKIPKTVEGQARTPVKSKKLILRVPKVRGTTSAPATASPQAPAAPNPRPKTRKRARDDADEQEAEDKNSTEAAEPTVAKRKPAPKKRRRA